MTLFDDHAGDVRCALRLFGRAPMFTAVAILTLALGSGANTAIFGLVDAPRLRTLPVPAPGRLAAFELRNAQGDRGTSPIRCSSACAPDAASSPACSPRSTARIASRCADSRRRAIVGTPIAIRDQAYTVVGVPAPGSSPSRSAARPTPGSR